MISVRAFECQRSCGYAAAQCGQALPDRCVPLEQDAARLSLAAGEVYTLDGKA